MKRWFDFDKERRDGLVFWHLQLRLLSGETYGISCCAPADPARQGLHVLPGYRSGAAWKLRHARRVLREKMRQEDDKLRKQMETAGLSPFVSPFE